MVGNRSRELRELVFSPKRASLLGAVVLLGALEHLSSPL